MLLIGVAAIGVASHHQDDPEGVAFEYEVLE
jgi:hypothetical protein